MKRVGVLGNYFLPERAGAPSVFGAYYLNKDYVDSFKNLPVLPLTIPYLESAKKREAFLDQIDGLVLTGGFDIPSRFFGEEEAKGAKFIYDEARADFELDLLQEVQKRNLNIFAICLGIQMFNVHRGGTLIQDIPSQVPGCLDHSHSNKDARTLAHGVSVIKGTRRHEIIGKESIQVNSSHHQALGMLGEGLRVSAVAEDGIIEAIECESGKFFGVQWHPESLQYEHEDHARLFEAFAASL